MKIGTVYKLTEVRKFLKNAYTDYKYTNKDDKLSKLDKKLCYFRIMHNLLTTIWNGITSPFIYPVWYLFRKQITEQVYKGTTWQEISQLMNENKGELVKSKLKVNGKLYFWLWTYGDANDPLGRGGLSKDYLNGKNNFWNRYRFSGWRNARFNINFLDFRTSTIIDSLVVVDKRNFNYLHKSMGIGDSPDGIYFKWMKDDKDNWHFIYEDNNANQIFYIGYVGLNDLNDKNGRFEIAYRVTDSSYRK